jgi:hypothetical protein
MTDFARNFIDMYGNQAVKDLTAEVNRRLNQHDPDTAVGEVLYGLPKDKANLDNSTTGSDWIEHAAGGEFGSSNQICFKSDTMIPEKFENHLVWFYSKIDPDVVLRNKYSNDYGHFIGVRYKLVRDGKIITFHRHLEIEHDVVFEKDDDIDEEITWEELWDKHALITTELRQEVITQFPFAAKHPDNR